MLIHFSLRLSVSPPQEAQHHQKWLTIALIYSLRSRQLFFLASLATFFLIFFPTCHTSNCCKICFRNFCMYARIYLCLSVVMLPILMPKSWSRSTTFLNPSNSILCELPASLTCDMWKSRMYPEWLSIKV